MAESTDDSLRLSTSQNASEGGGQGPSISALAGAVAAAIHQSLATNLARRQGERAQTSVPQTPETVSGHSSRNLTPFERAAKRPKFSPPTLFENLRKRRKKSSGSSSGQSSKVNYYVRDVVLLPEEFAKGNIVPVPRCSSRTRLRQGRPNWQNRIPFCYVS